MSNNLPIPSEPPGLQAPFPSEVSGAAYRQVAGDDAPSGNLRLLWRRVYGSLWRYKWLALAIFVVGTSIGFYVSRVALTPIYSARTTLWIDGYRPSAHEGPIQSSRLLTSAGWMELIRSFAVLDPVVKELRLYLEPRSSVDPRVFATFEADSAVRAGEYRFQVDRTGSAFTLSTAEGATVQQGTAGEVIGQPAGFQWEPPQSVFAPGAEIEFTVHRPHQMTQKLASDLQIGLRDEGNFMSLSLSGEDPARVAATVNAIARRFVVVAGELKASQSTELTQILAEQLAAAAQNLQSSEAALQGFRVGAVTLPSDRVLQQAPGLQSTQGTVFTNYFGLKMDREQLRHDREAITAALDQNSGPLSVATLELIPSVRNSSELSRALGELTTKRAELRTLRNQFTDQYLSVQRLMEEVEGLEKQAIPRLATHLMREIADREAAMDGRLASASDELRQIPERSIEEARLERSIAIAAELYRMLRQRYEAARLTVVSSVPDVQILDRARVPNTPVNDNEWTKQFLMFLVGSLGLALAAPVLLDRVDPRLRYPEQVTNDLGLPILGAIPHLPLANGKRQRALDPEPTAAAVEALREIRFNVTQAFGTAGPFLTTITSPEAGDGKSFVTSNLALAFADLGHKTLIIDGDLRQGQLHRLMGAVRIPGLTDYLGAQATLEEIIQPTGFASLDFIACGTRLQSAPELLNSAAMASLLREMRARYSVILVDSPPLGAGVDPYLLSTLTGNTLLVLRTGRTDRELTLNKLALLDRFPIRLLGAVLNDVPATGVYRYYRYNSYYEAQNEEPQAEAAETRPLERV
jgi:polysaccharide biosynthesis transport protein